MHQRLMAGAMSGTSADGVDVAIVRIAGRGMAMTPELLRHHHMPYELALRSRIRSVRTLGWARLDELAALGHDLTLCYAQAVNTAANGFEPLTAIAAHGQTLYHAPPLTIQWIDPALLAARTQTAVISDFRRADCAAGGQGAPLVPYADYLLFRHSHKNRVLLNIGGIANLTYLPAGQDISHAIAFDTGPGNCISDMLALPESSYDAGGQRAARGRTDPAVLEQALAHPWFMQRPPKSTDGPAMIRLFREAMGKPGSTEDMLRTACDLSARTIADAMRHFCPLMPDELIASGGGVCNLTMMNLLREQLPRVQILTADQIGVPSAAKEAMAFALLGAATLDGEASNVPSCTGARHQVILGSITPRPVACRHSLPAGRFD
jgi:anhydro-N-acetylmuramic acid kinase